MPFIERFNDLFILLNIKFNSIINKKLILLKYISKFVLIENLTNILNNIVYLN